jgi:opacity protein-like surface antigen
MLKTGWYLGAQAGYDSYRVRENVSGTILGTGFAANPVLSGNGWVGGLFLGYGMMMNDWFYLGGELFGNFSGVDQNMSATINGIGSVNTSFQVNGSWGLGLLPGIKMTDSTLTYVRLGWNWANLKQTANIMNAANAILTSGSKTNTSNGFVFGVGMETLIVDNWSLRGEFDHTWYSNYNVISAAPALTVTTNPSDNQYMLSVIYHFA